MNKIIRWGALWRSGDSAHVMCTDRMPLLFNTREQARSWIAINYGYIKKRPDLTGCPHYWKMPVPVKVEIKGVK